MAGKAPVISADIGTVAMAACGRVITRFRIRAVGFDPVIRLRFSALQTGTGYRLSYR